MRDVHRMNPRLDRQGASLQGRRDLGGIEGRTGDDHADSPRPKDAQKKIREELRKAEEEESRSEGRSGESERSEKAERRKQAGQKAVDGRTGRADG